jgi:16S rRNA (cytosine967-C5)-methyltransferase
MQASAHLQAAIEILQHWHEHPQSLSVTAKAWARGHRFAGAKDRAAIMDYVYQALRVAASARQLLRADADKCSSSEAVAPNKCSSSEAVPHNNAARAEVLGSLALAGATPEHIAALCEGPHAPSTLTESERERIARASQISSEQTAATRANLPEWLWSSWTQQYGEQAAAQAQALQLPSSLDLRVNSLRARADTRAELEALGFSACQFPSTAMRISTQQRQAGKRPPNLQQHPRFLSGEFEIQDRSSQIAIALCDIQAGMRVLDLCAGAGGKSLGLAAKLANECEIHTFDVSHSQQADLQARIARSGASCIKPIATGDQVALQRRGPFDAIVLDAPCSGSGTWRRSPDAKWRFKPEHLQKRIQQQRALLQQATGLLKPNGIIYYWTCSLLAAENQQQVDHFLRTHRDFHLADWRTLPGANALLDANPDRLDLALSPLHHDCDGFFFAKLVKHEGCS